MKKKVKVLALVVVLALFALMAVGSGSSSSEKKEVVSSDNSTETATTEEKTEDSTAASENSSAALPSIEETVLLDRDGIKITATEYTTDSIWGDGIALLIENNSDTDYTIGCDALIVNGYMIDDLFYSEIAAGKKANETMYLYSSELKAAGIDTVGEIEMYFHAYDSSFNNLFQNEYAQIQTSEYANMDTTANDEGTELYNEGGIRIVGKTVDENSFWGTAILLYIENTSGTNVGISVDDMSINGFMMDPLFSTTVYDGKKDIADITILSTDLEDNGIESIDDVELKFHIYNASTFETIADSDSISFSAQ